MTSFKTIILATTTTTTALLVVGADAFSTITPITHPRAVHYQQPSLLRLQNNVNDDSNAWKNVNYDTEDWETLLEKKKDGSYWSSFESSSSDDTTEDAADGDSEEDEAVESRLDTLALLNSEEATFNVREAQRADTARRMEEWGFEASTIASALDVAVVEERNDVEGMQVYRKASYLLDDDEDLTTVESHTKVPIDPVTKEPMRSQMVYVDEHACIGCTNCAMIAQSTFFMEEENGRARVFEQWGDDETTVEIARETCPVDCIHYVPYDELVQLEVRRRDQYINVLAGLVSRAERGAGSGLMSSTPRSFGPKSFTNAPKISRGYEIGNEEFDIKEKDRLFAARKSKLQAERRRNNKIVDL